MLKTSITKDVIINYLQGDDLCGKSGKIGITNLPPKNNLDEYFKLLETHKIDIIVSLIESFDDFELFDFRKRADELGFQSIWFPIEDLSIPADRDEFLELVDNIVKACDDGKSILIHCLGGKGRSGTVAAACLIRMGVEPTEAIKITRKVRKGAIETKQQENFLKNDFLAKE